MVSCLVECMDCCMHSMWQYEANMAGTAPCMAKCDFEPSVGGFESKEINGQEVERKWIPLTNRVLFRVPRWTLYQRCKG